MRTHRTSNTKNSGAKETHQLNHDRPKPTTNLFRYFTIICIFLSRKKILHIEVDVSSTHHHRIVVSL